jgi:SnoaL-like domain
VSTLLFCTFLPFGDRSAIFAGVQSQEYAMSIRLPAPIDRYFASENAHDTAAIDECFVADAIVRDENKTLRGVAAIKAWRVETGRKYQHSVEPLTVSTRDEKVVVTGEVAGDFPGSPITLEHIFQIEGGRIVYLEIRP